MGTQRQQAVAQAQKTGEITKLESLELVKCLLRVSIYHVSYLRGLFPAANFKGVDMQNLEGMHIEMLNGVENEEAKRLIDWVEGGVVDAIRKKYLHKLFFGIANDRDAKSLLEEYVFTFNYDAAGNVTMALGAGGRKKTFKDQANQKPTVDTVKYQVIRLMRMLVGICQTLEQVPQERFLFMKLTYHENTPEDYEPPFFEPAGDRAVGTFARKPFAMQVGQVGTDYHQVGLHVKSVLDAMDGVRPEQQPEEDCVSGQEGSCCSDHSDSMLQDEEEESMGGCSPGDRGRKQVGLEDLYTAPPEQLLVGSADAGSRMAPAEPDQQVLDDIKAYVLRRSEVHIVDLLGFFPTLPQHALDGCMAALVADGVLERQANSDVFAVNQSKAPLGEEVINKAMNKLAVAFSKPMESNIGGVHEYGSQGTQSQVALAAAPPKRKAADAGQEASQAAEALWVDATQQSQPLRRHSKASFVEDAIHQREAKKAKKEEKEVKTGRGRRLNGMRR